MKKNGAAPVAPGPKKGRKHKSWLDSMPEGVRDGLATVAEATGHSLEIAAASLLQVLEQEAIQAVKVRLTADREAKLAALKGTGEVESGANG